MNLVSSIHKKESYQKQSVIVCFMKIYLFWSKNILASISYKQEKHRLPSSLYFSPSATSKKSIICTVLFVWLFSYMGGKVCLQVPYEMNWCECWFKHVTDSITQRDRSWAMSSSWPHSNYANDTWTWFELGCSWESLPSINGDHCHNMSILEFIYLALRIHRVLE